MKKRIITSIVMIFASLTLCGAGWFNTTKVVVDTENNPVYEFCSVDEMLSGLSADRKAVAAKYKNMPVLLAGKVKSVSADGKDLVITGTENAQVSMECTYDKTLRSEIKNYKAGDTIAMYGQVDVGIFTGEPYFKTEKVTAAPAGRTSGMYYMQNGASFDRRDTVKETLHNGDAVYYVPSSWTGKEIRRNVTEENLGTMEGYQYVLNKLGSADPVPESVFVCYFDNATQLGYAGDAGETKLIEKAIVENILGSVGLFPTKKVTTYYGEEYNYYDGVFKNALEAGEGYRTEFIFRADGEEGIVVVLYVYKEAKHADDLLFLMRFLEVNE